ncbi:hypothetical protein ACOSP7_007047 [Xanthoceras sorbifolium]
MVILGNIPVSRGRFGLKWLVAMAVLIVLSNVGLVSSDAYPYYSPPPPYIYKSPPPPVHSTPPPPYYYKSPTIAISSTSIILQEVPHHRQSILHQLPTTTSPRHHLHHLPLPNTTTNLLHP